ncbi:MAG: DUF4878 domain-containing protein [Rikenellaceae bacterium]
MKKVFALLTVLCAFVCFVSCSSQSSPKDAAEKYAKCVQKGDFEGLVDLFYMKSTGDTAKDKEQKDQLVSMFNEKAKPEIEKKGGIKSYTIGEETISEDGESAKVKVTFEYGDGTTDDEKTNLEKVDGKWYLSMKK